MDGFDVAAERKRQGLNQAQLAAAMGLHVGAVIAIERNQPVAPSPEVIDLMLGKIAELAAAAGKVEVAK